jgi:hypothetical protein
VAQLAPHFVAQAVPLPGHLSHLAVDLRAQARTIVTIEAVEPLRRQPDRHEEKRDHHDP